MKLKEIGTKIAELLYLDEKVNGTINFDWKTYVDEDDIPTLKIGNTKHKVATFHINKDGDEITITTYREDLKGWWDYTYYLDFDIDTDNEFGADNEEDYEKVLEEMGTYELLRNVYYETNVSCVLGYFENSFLNIK